jgi:hypothetical protein
MRGESVSEGVARMRGNSARREQCPRKRLHYNVLAVALANKLARIAWSVLARGRAFEASKLQVA